MPNSPTGSPAAGTAISDANLAAGVGNGTFREAQAALKKLYRRHQPSVTAGAYARALQAMRGRRGPEGVWGPYLLTTRGHRRVHRGGRAATNLPRSVPLQPGPTGPLSAAATPRWAYLRFDGLTAFAQRDSSPVQRRDGPPLPVAIASIPFRGRCLW